MDQLQQGVLHGDVERLVEFGDEIAGRGTVDEGGGGVDQGAEARKPHGILRPQAVVVKASDTVEGIVAAAMRVAGSIVELIEFAKDGNGGAAPRAPESWSSVAILVRRRRRSMG